MEKQIESSFGAYLRSKPECLPVPDLAQPLDMYRKHITQRFITRREEDILNLSGKKFITSIKVDSAFTGYYYDEKEKLSFYFNTPTHRIFVGLPINKEMEDLLKSNGIKKILLVGEMFASKNDPVNFNERSTVYDLIHYRRNPTSEDDINRIGFRAFDLLELEGESWIERDYKARYKKLSEIFSENGRVAMVMTRTFENVHEVQKFYRNHVIKEGHEGVIVRTGSITYKIKPVHSIDVAIIAAAEGREDLRLKNDQLATALVGLRYPDGIYQVLTRVGGGLTDEQRTDIWSKLEFIDSVNFTSTTRDGRAMKMVKPSLLGKIEYFDILSDHDGEPIMQPSLKFDEKKNQWEMIRPMPFVKLIHPRFIQEEPIREDKDVKNIDDVRIHQITDLLDIQTFESVSEIDLEKSEMLARHVYNKKEEAVRKFIAWKTNKGTSGFFPEYAVYYLDYSQNRKKPINRSLQITDNKEQLWALFDEWIKNEMIGTKGDLKRGWTQYSQYDIRNESSG